MPLCTKSWTRLPNLQPIANKLSLNPRQINNQQSATSHSPRISQLKKIYWHKKTKEREQRAAAQNNKAQQYADRATADWSWEALARSRAENQLYANKNAANTNSVVASSVTAITQPVVKPRPVDTVAAPPQTQTTVPNSVQNAALDQNAAKTKILHKS